MPSRPLLSVLVVTPMKDQLLKKLQEEFATLDRELKLELPKEIKRARELGDLRENAEYHAAKERQSFVQARLSMLQKRIMDVSRLDIDRLPRDKAGLGSTLHLREDNGATVVYQLVMPEDADPDKGLVSVSSPIGRALLNKEQGDDVKVVAPSGTRRFEVTRLITIHDADS
jgi:transcription elongation factor GreA